MSRLFPDKEIQIESRCPDCGDTVTVRCRGSELLSVEPDTAVAHANEPIRNWASQGWPFT